MGRKPDFAWEPKKSDYVRKSILKAVVFVLVVAFVLSSTLLLSPNKQKHSAQAAEWKDFDWGYRKTITVDHTKVSSSDQTDFPMLVNLTSDADLAAQAQDSGNDILFTSSNGTTKLSHQIEKFDGGTGALAAWVRIPTLSSTSDTVIYMYYGNAGASSQQDAENVWDANTKAAYHYSEASGTLYDSTSNANNGTATGALAYDATGQISKAVTFNGTDSYISVPDSASQDTTNSLTISGWFKKPDVLSDTVIDTTANDIKTDLTTATAIVAGDMNNDGYIDLVANSYATLSEIQYYKNNGDGTFTKYTVGTQATIPRLRLADMNGDGFLDVVGIWYSGTSKIYWWKNNGDDSFTAQTAITLGGNSYSTDIDIADMDGDGDLDMIAAGNNSKIFYLAINSGAPNYTFTVQNIAVDCTLSIPPGSCDPRALSTAIADLNSDGLPDFVVGSGSNGQYGYWMQNNGGSPLTFTQHQLTNLGTSGMKYIQPTDLNNDGKIDLLYENGTRYLYTILGDGAGNFGAESPIYYNSAVNNPYPYAADFNGDGFPDVAYALSASNLLAWIAGNGSGGFGAATTINALTNATATVAADFDNDGDMDIAAISTSTNTVTWFKNNGSGVFSKQNYKAESASQVVKLNAGGKLSVNLTDTNGLQCGIDSASRVDDNAFHRFSAVWDDSNLKLYVDGSAVRTKSCSYLGTINNTSGITLGKNSALTLDELRYSAAARSLGYVTTEYNNQSSPASFYTLQGSPEAADTASPTNPTTTHGYDTAAKAHEFTTGSWKNYANPYFEWSGATAGDSGVDGYWVYFGATADAEPSTAGSYQTAANYTSSAALASGSTYYLRVRTKSGHGKLADAGATLFTYKYDSANPSPPEYVNVSPVGCSTETNFTFTWPAAVDTGGSGIASYEYKKSMSGAPTDIGDVLTLTTTAYQNNDNVMYVRALDNAGNYSDWRTVIYCKVAAAEIIDGPDATVSYNSVTVEWVSSLQTTSYVKVYADGGVDPISEQGSPTMAISHAVTVLGLDPETAYEYQVTWTDGNGNTGSGAKVDFTTDAAPTTPAPPEYVTVSPAGCSTESTFTFTWPAVTDAINPIVGYQYKFGSIGATQETTAVTVSSAPYQEGDNVFYVRSKNSMSNTSSWMSAIFCATSTAHLLDGPTVAAGPSSITVSWISSKTTTGYVKVYDGNTYVSEQGHTEYTSSHSVRVVGLRAEKEYRYQIVWADSNGNLGQSQWYETSTAVAPAVKNLDVELLSPTEINVSWGTTQNAECVIEYGAGSYSSSETLEGSAVSFSRKLSSLNAGTTYQLRIKATATDDGTEFFAAKDFSTPPLPEASGLKFEPVTDKSSPSLKVAWTTNTETTSTVFYRVKGAGKYEEISSSDKVKDHELIINNLIDSTIYEIYVGGIDAYGNEAKSEVNTYATPLDTRPPNVSDIIIETSNVGIGREDTAQIAVSWKTDEPATSKVEYSEGISGDQYTSNTIEDPTQTNSHLVIVSGLKQSTPYHLRVCSKDKGNNTACSEDNTVIPGEVKQSILNTILNTFKKAFGPLTGKLFK